MLSIHRFKSTRFQDGLLSSLINLSRSFKCQPSHVIKFPIRSTSAICDLELSVRSLDDGVLTASIRPVSDASSRHPTLSVSSSRAPRLAGLSVDPMTDSVDSIAAQSMEGSSAQCPANLAPLQVPLRENTLWPTNQRGFSICFWMLIEGAKVPQGHEERPTPFSQMLAENTAEHGRLRYFA